MLTSWRAATALTSSRRWSEVHRRKAAISRGWVGSSAHGIYVAGDHGRAAHDGGIGEPVAGGTSTCWGRGRHQRNSSFPHRSRTHRPPALGEARVHVHPHGLIAGEAGVDAVARRGGGDADAPV